LTLLSEYTPEELTRLATTVPGPFEDVQIPVPSRPGVVKISKKPLSCDNAVPLLLSERHCPLWGQLERLVAGFAESEL
ncbi:TPA: hypothetical protein ACP61A_004777, partial [Escherichia coli]